VTSYLNRFKFWRHFNWDNGFLFWQLDLRTHGLTVFEFSKRSTNDTKIVEMLKVISQVAAVDVTEFDRSVLPRFCTEIR